MSLRATHLGGARQVARRCSRAPGANQHPDRVMLKLTHTLVPDTQQIADRANRRVGGTDTRTEVA
jgi:hypothetical protein